MMLPGRHAAACGRLVVQVDAYVNVKTEYSRKQRLSIGHALGKLTRSRDDSRMVSGVFGGRVRLHLNSALRCLCCQVVDLRYRVDSGAPLS